MKSAGNAVIPTFPAHCPHGLQHLRYKRPTFAFADESGYNSPLPTGSHTAAYTPKEGAFRMGRYHYPRHELHVHKHPRAGWQNGKLCRFWVLVGGALEERRKPSGQRCAYACRCPEGVAAPLGCVIFSVSVEIAACTPCAQSFLCVRGMGGITTLGVLCVLLKRRTAACQNGSFAVFLRPLFTFAKDPAG